MSDAAETTDILCEIQDGVAFVTFNRPEKLNALTPGNFRDIKHLFRDLARDENVRAVLLTGVGRAFCVGADLSATENTDNQSPGDFAGDAMHGYLTLAIRAIAECPKPVVVAVNGLAVGGGMSIALLGDIVIAAQSAKFTQVFTPKLGIVPDAGSTWLLPRAIGSARAMGLMMLGEPLDAERAESWGLIWKVVGDDALQAEAKAVALQLAQGPTTGFGLLKKTLAVSAKHSFHEQLHVETEANRQAFATEDCTEATNAFLEKRPAKFIGR